MLTFNVAGAKNKIIFVDETNKSLQKQLKESIEKGTDGNCDLVVPHTFDDKKQRNCSWRRNHSWWKISILK